MEKDKNLEQTPISETEKLHLFGVINSISPEILKELYQMGFDDGWEELAGTEGYGDRGSIGFDKVIEQLYQKYCL